jgi:hypothetical protein
VRNNIIRTLKTENANRQVVLGALAYPFAELLDPVYALFREAGSLGTDLSCGVSDDVIVPIIHEALQAITGGQDCHLHTLRHSAAHWMFMRLMVADLDQIPEMFPHLPKTTQWLKASKKVRSLLLHNCQAMNDHAWEVAAMMGHSNPNTVTLRYYVHCLDLLLAQFLEARTIPGTPATRDELRSLSGLPRSTAYFRLPAPCGQYDNTDLAGVTNDTPSDGLSSFEPEREFALKIFRERLGLTIRVNDRPAPPLSEPGFWLKKTYEILWMSFELGMSSDKLANIFGLDQQIVDAILYRADSILSIGDSQHSAEGALKSRDVPNEAHVDCCAVPRLPKIGIDSEVLHRWSTALENIVGRNRECATAAVKYMALNMVPASDHIVFMGAPRPELVQSCLGVFGTLGFRIDNLHAITCDGTTHVRPLREWLRSWGLSWRISVTNQSGRERMLKVPQPWVVVGPKLLEGTATLSQRQQAEAICFLITMAAIRFAA